MLKAGYLEDWEWNATLSAVLRKAVSFPLILSVTSTWTGWTISSRQALIPEYTQGSPQGKQSCVQTGWTPGDGCAHASAATGPRPGSCASSCARLPYGGSDRDPGYRRLRYARYADDHLLGFTGPKAEAEEIKTSAWRRSCATTLALELSAAKTLITHARTQPARFLGYQITVQHTDTKITKGPPRSTAGSRCACPGSVIKAK